MSARRLPRSLALLALSLAAFMQTACARGPTLVDLQVTDGDSGYLLPRYGFRGRDYLAGEPGQRFNLSLRNLTGERVLAVVSVDGVNVISGQTANPQQTGYVLEPWQQIAIQGWRKSYQDVARFYFTDLGDSYAARTGRPEHVGVIGVAAFREKSYPVEPQVYSYERERGLPAPVAKSSSRAADAAAESSTQSIGTGHGERTYAPVQRTHFERASASPQQITRLFYDSPESLMARGVIPQRPYYGRNEPQAFPGGFTPDPTW